MRKSRIYLFAFIELHNDNRDTKLRKHTYNRVISVTVRQEEYSYHVLNMMAEIRVADYW